MIEGNSIVRSAFLIEGGKAKQCLRKNLTFVCYMRKRPTLRTLSQWETSPFECYAHKEAHPLVPRSTKYLTS